MNCSGIPGAQGLGQCAYCGENFMMDIVLGRKVTVFEWNDNKLAAHKTCFKQWSQREDWQNYPDGPIKQFLTKHQDLLNETTKEN